MTNQKSFRLDSEEFGEVYYALVAKALEICPISWTSNLSDSNMRLGSFYQSIFGDNTSKNCVRYNKTQFRIDLAKRDGEFHGKLMDWFNNIRQNFNDPEVEAVVGEKIALIWNRRKGSECPRNSTDDSLIQLVRVCKAKKYTPVLVGDKAANWKELGFDFDRTNFHGDYKLNHIQQIAYLFNLINKRTAFSIGLQSGGMDGLALFGGIPTIFLSTEETAKNGMAELANRISDVFCWCEIQYEGKFEKFDNKVLQAVEKKIDDYEILGCGGG